MCFNLSHHLPQVLACTAGGVCWSRHLSNNSIIGNSPWFSPKQHVPMYSTTLLIFLLPDVVNNFTKWFTFVVTKVGVHKPVEPLLGNHHTNVWVGSCGLPIGEGFSQIDISHLLCCTPSILDGCLDMRPGIIDCQRDKEVRETSSLCHGNEV